MFVVFDVETTGLFPSRHDRIVEIAAVRVGESGEIEREFVSLINPQRDIGPTSIHGLVSADVLDAPVFNDLAGEIAEFFDDAVGYGGHNVVFDADFLRAEFNRCGLSVPDLPLVCTMRGSGGGSLSNCCDTYGLPAPSEAHSALDDARATAMLLVELYRRRLLNADFRPTRWPQIAKSGRKAVTRTEARLRPRTNHYLQRLAELNRDGPATAGDAASWAYLALLDRVMEDRRIDSGEGDALIETAVRWGLSLDKVENLHDEFLRRLGAVALIDGVVTKSERGDIHHVATLLGRSIEEVDTILDEAQRQMARLWSAPKEVSTELKGKSVCFTGELLATLRGAAISRTEAQALASRAGLNISTGVTKKLELLVVADPHTQSGKAKKAREYGVRIMAENVFWKAIGVNVD